MVKVVEEEDKDIDCVGGVVVEGGVMLVVSSIGVAVWSRGTDCVEGAVVEERVTVLVSGIDVVV